MTVLVSVIVPVYKVEPYLERCVNSILAQTHRELDVILIDDGSPDRCGRICDDYAHADLRVKVIHQVNGGLSAARNAGLDAARGDFITFVDSDDWIHPTLLAELLRVLDRAHADIAVCRHCVADSEQQQCDATSTTTREFSPDEALAELLGPDYVTMVVAWGKLYRASLFESIRFPVGRLHEDNFTTHRLFQQASRVVLTDAQLYCYRQREGSITAARSPAARADMRLAFRDRAVFLHRVGLAQQGDETFARAMWMLIRDRRRLGRRDGSLPRRELQREMRSLAASVLAKSGSRRLRVRVALNCIAPRLIDSLARRRDARLGGDPVPTMGPKEG